MQMKKLVSVILAVCMLVSMFTILPLSAGAETATKTITVGVVDYLDLSGDYQVHYWGGADSGDAAATAINTQKQKSVGQDYWQGGEMTYNMFEATIPADATGFKFHIGETWFGDDGNTADSNAVYAFEYGGNYLAYYDNETPAAPETQAPTTAPETQAPTTAPASEAPVANTITVYFTDALNWGAANIYYWESELKWPGTAMTVFEEENDFGQTVYKAVIPADVTGIIFNGNGNQTVDITEGIADGKGWYTTDEKEDNKYKVGEFTVDEPETTAPTTAPETTAPTTAPETTAPTEAATDAPIVGGITYYLVGDMTGWGINPDYALTKNAAAEADEYMISGVTFTAEQGFKVVGYNSSIQDFKPVWYPDGMDNDCVIHDAGTYDIYFRPNYDGGEDWYYGCIYVVAPEVPTEASSEAAPETTAPTTAPETTAPTTTPVTGNVTVYFTNNKGWNDLKIHMWNDDGESTEWPGVNVNYVGDNDYGEAIFSAAIDTAKYDHFIFNGNGGQTADIAVADAVAGGLGVYCLDTQDGEGRYNVGFYEYAAEPETTAPSTAPETTAPTTAPETTAPVALTDGYYVVGDINGWTAKAEYKLAKNDAAEIDEYMIYGVAFTAEQGFKVVSVKDGKIEAWYPTGMDNNCVINDAGTYDIYFRPGYNGGEDWYEGCIYVTASTETPTEPATEPATEPSTEPATEPSTEPDPSLNGIVDGYYYENGELAKGKGLIEFEGNIYFVKNDGSLYTSGTLKVVEAKTNGILAAGSYSFDAEGKLVTDGIVDGYYYVNGEKVKGAGIIEYKGNFYFVKNDGSLYTNGRLAVPAAKTNGLLPAAAYNFDENGKLLCNGEINGYFYIDGDKAKGAGVVAYGGSLYFVKNDGTLYKNGRLAVAEAKTNGLVAAGAYNFDENGKMQEVERIYKGYYYLNGKRVPGAGIIEYKGNLYFVKNNAAIYTNGRLSVPEAKTNGLVPAGAYTFDETGKLIK